MESRVLIGEIMLKSVSRVFIFSWNHCKSQEKMETMCVQSFGGQTKGIMYF